MEREEKYSTEEPITLEEECKQLRLEQKKLKREVKRITRDNELLRVANQQATRTQAFIQKENQRQFFFIKQLLKTLTYILILTDADMQTVMASDLFYQYSDYDETRILTGISLDEALKGILDAESLTYVLDNCRKILDQKSATSFIRRSTAFDKNIDYQINISAMTKADELVGLNIVFQDITEIMESKERAEAADKAKSSFLANMSHEIRTPINAILGMNEMILRECEEQDIKMYAGDIKTAGKTLLALINEILDFSKVEEGKMEIIPTHYDLGILLTDLINMVQERVDKKGLLLNIRVDENIPHVLYGDEIRIKQCALNLLNNAVKYTEKGSVGLDVGYRNKGENSIYLEFHISDTGIGMKEEDLQKLFSPFTRIEEKRNRNIEGTGLGMTITKKLLDLMGSTLTVDSVYGKGSDFMFTVEQQVIEWNPIGDFSLNHENTRFSAYCELFHAPDAKLLVVDDTEMNLEVITGLLKRTKAQVETALSGAEAIKMFQKQDYDIVFIDHMMPELDGIETLQIMKELPNYDKMVPIALTANAISGAREMYLEAGFVDYLSKPVDGEVLERMIQKYLPLDKVKAVEAGTEEAAMEATQTDAVSIPDWIYEIEEIKVPDGIHNCGSEKEFLSIVRVFHETFPKKMQEIKGFFEQEDWENYTIKVHALKSSLRIIGALDLASLAEKMEMAGKADDLTYIHEHHEELLDQVIALDARLTPREQESQDAPVIEHDMLIDAYQSMYEYVCDMDYGLLDELIKSLKSYQMPQEDRECLDALYGHLLELDWDSMDSILQDKMFD